MFLSDNFCTICIITHSLQVKRYLRKYLHIFDCNALTYKVNFTIIQSLTNNVRFNMYMQVTPQVFVKLFEISDYYHFFSECALYTIYEYIDNDNIELDMSEIVNRFAEIDKSYYSPNCNFKIIASYSDKLLIDTYKLKSE